jgi:hypothetical protein
VHFCGGLAPYKFVTSGFCVGGWDDWGWRWEGVTLTPAGLAAPLTESRVAFPSKAAAHEKELVVGKLALYWCRHCLCGCKEVRSAQQHVLVAAHATGRGNTRGGDGNERRPWHYNLGRLWRWLSRVHRVSSLPPKMVDSVPYQCTLRTGENLACHCYVSTHG